MSWEWSIDGWILAAALLGGLSCALLGNFLVLRRMSLMGDAISHAVLPGLAIAFLLTESRSAVAMFAGAAVAGVLTAMLSELIRRSGKVEHGAAMGVVFSVLFAIGLVLIRKVTALDHVDLDPDCVLYGNINLVGLEGFQGDVPWAVRNLAIVLGLNIAFVGLFYKELKISSFDPELATTLGIPSGLMHYALMTMVAVTTVANFEAVGSILVIGMLIIPAATAHLLTDRMGYMIMISLAVAALSAVMGHLSAAFGPQWVGLPEQFSDVSITPMIVVSAAVLLCMAILFSPEYGLLSRCRRRLKLTLQIVGEDILGLLYRYEELKQREDPCLKRGQVLGAVGGTWRSAFALRALHRRRDVIHAPDAGLALSEQGTFKAAQLIRGHRLWEVYLAKHFQLPLDHLHAPAERVEHFLRGELGEQLGADLAEVRRDPQGKDIPET